MTSDQTKVAICGAVYAGALVGFIGFVIFAGNVPSHGSSACMTKSEARAVWPKRHIYWHGAEHCWDNSPSWHRPRADRARAEEHTAHNKKDRLDMAAEQNKMTPAKPAAKTEVLYPPLLPNQVVSQEFLAAVPMTGWPLLLDIDRAPAASSSSEPDYCCWPDLKALENETRDNQIKKIFSVK